jgi:hypothetical protein
MEKENLVMLLKYKEEKDIYPVEQKILCATHYNEEKTTDNNYQVNKVNSSMPNLWCETCNPMN